MIAIASVLSMTLRPLNVYSNWQHLPQHRAPSILHRFFDIRVDEYDEIQTELFCIEGIPAAAILFNDTNSYGDPNVSAIILNKGLILMFDAGEAMRKQLFTRHRYITLRHAHNRDFFFSCQ